MSTEAARELVRRRWDRLPKDGKICEVCGKPCRVKYCGNACKVKAYQERKRGKESRQNPDNQDL